MAILLLQLTNICTAMKISELLNPAVAPQIPASRRRLPTSPITNRNNMREARNSLQSDREASRSVDSGLNKPAYQARLYANKDSAMKRYRNQQDTFEAEQNTVTTTEPIAKRPRIGPYEHIRVDEEMTDRPSQNSIGSAR